MYFYQNVCQTVQLTFFHVLLPECKSDCTTNVFRCIFAFADNVYTGKYRKALTTETPKIFTVFFLQMRQFRFARHRKDAEGMANSEDPDQTAPRSSLIWVSTICSIPTSVSQHLDIMQYKGQTV